MVAASIIVCDSLDLVAAMWGIVFHTGVALCSILIVLRQARQGTMATRQRCFLDQDWRVVLTGLVRLGCVVNFYQRWQWIMTLAITHLSLEQQLLWLAMLLPVFGGSCRIETIVPARIFFAAVRHRYRLQGSSLHPWLVLVCIETHVDCIVWCLWARSQDCIPSNESVFRSLIRNGCTASNCGSR